ncbi:MAG: asparagine synthase (glutamine-hydrolyzing) [Gammaproteobacteria bacterium]|nr:asparagine synthase (glutamine-hydrolyzing) [Gammaproteobacteria bacterium]
MCGIAGVINYQENMLSTLQLALKHRGPDAQTVYREKNVALVHTRLAIQDVDHGIQPFFYKNYAIIFNGEIYNHQVLRQSLTEFSFQTESDTETLLYLFIKFRYEMFTLIDGMFAFCIYDKLNNKIILAKDRAGKKPLYFHKTNRAFFFASELNALKLITPLEPSHEAIQTYLKTGVMWRPHTAYQEVYKLDAASYLEINTKNLSFQIKSYFNFLAYFQSSSSPLKFAQAVDKLNDYLKQSVADRIAASDVEVGVFLSGGIDSNLIAALAAQIKPGIKTFTVKFSGMYDESVLAKLAAKKYQTTHIELNIDSHIKQDIEKILLSYGEPFMDSSAIPSYYVSQEAAKHVKVVLSGDGADELFAGYRRYVPAMYSFATYLSFLTPLLKILPHPTHKKSVYNYFYRLLTTARKQNLDYYLSTTTDIFEDVLSIDNNPVTANLAEFVQSIFSNSTLSSLKKMLYIDFNVLLFCDLLVKMDIASMAHSLEVRSPFLAKNLLEFAPGLPDEYKIKNFKTKFILRKLAERYLPTQLINQPKRGFEVPLKHWVDNDLREPIFDRLQPGSYATNYIPYALIGPLLAKKLNISPEKRAKILWSLYCLEVWYANEKTERSRVSNYI